MALLPKNVYSESRLLIQRIAAVARATRQVIVNQSPISLHQSQSDLLRLIRRERFDWRIDIDWLQFAEVLDLHWMPHGKIQVRDAVIGLQHRGQDSIKIRNSHRSLLFIAVYRRFLEERPEFLFVDRLIVGFVRRNTRMA